MFFRLDAVLYFWNMSYNFGFQRENQVGTALSPRWKNAGFAFRLAPSAGVVQW
jgi:hypothetical protein